MARDDASIARQLLRADKRWRARFDTIEENLSDELKLIFGKLTDAKRDVILSAIARLELTPTGVILNNSVNEILLRRLLDDVERMNVGVYGPKGKVQQTVSPEFDRAARMGVRHALDSIRIGEPSALPNPGYTGNASMQLVDGAERLLLDRLRTGAVRDIDIIRQAFLLRINDPEATQEVLRRDLAKSGQIEGMLDTMGRRITVDERSDRIAKYELSKLAQESHEAAVGEVYFEGNYDPEEVWYLWVAVRDDRTQPEHEDRDGHVLTAAEWETRDWGDGTFGGPPLRPRCRCSRVFVMPHWFSKGVQSRVFDGDARLGTVVKAA